MPESRFYTSYVARHLASGVRPRCPRRKTAMRAVLLLAIVVFVLGCGRRGDPQSDAPEKAAPPQDVPAAAPTGSLAPDWRDARSELPAQNGRGLFQGREPNAPIQRRPRPVPPPELIVPGPAGPLPPPLTYVGKVARDGEGFAVLAREERVCRRFLFRRRMRSDLRETWLRRPRLLRGPSFRTAASGTGRGGDLLRPGYG